MTIRSKGWGSTWIQYEWSRQPRDGHNSPMAPSLARGCFPSYFGRAIPWRLKNFGPTSRPYIEQRVTHGRMSDRRPDSSQDAPSAIRIGPCFAMRSSSLTWFDFSRVERVEGKLGSRRDPRRATVSPTLLLVLYGTDGMRYPSIHPNILQVDRR